MRTKTVYYVTAKKRIEEDMGRIIYDDCSQYLLPNEISLIKTMLNDGIEITGVRKDKLTMGQYKALFG